MPAAAEPSAAAALLEVVMSDKSPHKTTAKKPGRTIKEKRAEKKAKHAAAERHDLIAEARKH
jgi:hypothetical protein